MNRHRLSIIAVFLVGGLFALQAHGDLIVDIRDSLLPAGGTGTVDVFITGSAPANQVRAYSFSFRIEPLGGATTSVRFVNPQSNSELSLPEYIFAGNSDVAANNPGFTGTVSTVNLPQDTFTFGDSTADASAVTVTGTERLLARLDVLHFLPGGSDPNATIGQQFSVSLVSATFTNASNQAIPFTSSSGDITITAVPEPSMGLLLIVAGSIGAAVRYRRKIPSSASEMATAQESRRCSPAAAG